MRLIDADGWIEAIKKETEDMPAMARGLYLFMVNKINKRPTAYDVDKTVERLRVAGGCDGSTEYARGWDDAMEEAERIVKAGRKSDAKAGWKEHIARRFGRVE